MDTDLTGHDAMGPSPRRCKAGFGGLGAGSLRFVFEAFRLRANRRVWGSGKVWEGISSLLGSGCQSSGFRLDSLVLQG